MILGVSVPRDVSSHRRLRQRRRLRHTTPIGERQHGGDDPTPKPDGTESAGTAGGGLTAAIQFGDANSGLDPLNMLDLGTYSVLSQSFEYLVGLGPDGNIAPTALATGWTPNDDGSVWTFELREASSGTMAATSPRLTSPPPSTAWPSPALASDGDRRGLNRFVGPAQGCRDARSRQTATSQFSSRSSIRSR